MDAKTFISKKHEAAVEELQAIEAEYRIKKEAAQATLDITQKWLEELTGEKPSVSEDAPKSGVNSWLSTREVTAQSGRS